MENIDGTTLDKTFQYCSL